MDRILDGLVMIQWKFLRQISSHMSQTPLEGVLFDTLFPIEEKDDKEENEVEEKEEEKE